MKKLLLILLVWFFVGHFSAAQQGFQPVPELPYHAVPNFFKFPKGMIQGEAAGVAVNSKGHIYLFQRTKAMLTEYDEAGNYVQSIGEGLFQHPHGLRVDADDNPWTTDDGNNLVLKLSPSGQGAFGSRPHQYCR